MDAALDGESKDRGRGCWANAQVVMAKQTPPEQIIMGGMFVQSYSTSGSHHVYNAMHMLIVGMYSFRQPPGLITSQLNKIEQI